MTRDIIINVNTGAPAKKTQVQANVNSPTRHSPETKNVSESGRMMKAAGVVLAKRAMTDYSSRIGDRTGQRAHQQNIDNAMQIASVGFNLLIGFKVGGAVGLGVAGAYTGYQAIMRNVDLQRQRSEQETMRDYYRSYAIMANRSSRAGGAL